MVGIEIPGILAVFLGVLGAVWIFLDGRKRNIETADMWAVGFFVGMFIPPIVGAVIVGMLYLQKRNPGQGGPIPNRQYR
ncbi:hypothetical protein [Haloarchaeobius iranensis]|uniref:hypothetical protein n=1 Tax=Haloarchaeobius iranensis TaxID=996166 RepID=UPI000B7EDC2F|nr:hypothetical protein [Haloarchaeobius iranensis]